MNLMIHTVPSYVCPVAPAGGDGANIRGHIISFHIEHIERRVHLDGDHGANIRGHIISFHIDHIERRVLLDDTTFYVVYVKTNYVVYVVKNYNITL